MFQHVQVVSFSESCEGIRLPLSEHMRALLGQPLVIENVTGAGTTIVHVGPLIGVSAGGK
jgi:hypothetical protein